MLTGSALSQFSQLIQGPALVYMSILCILALVLVLEIVSFAVSGGTSVSTALDYTLDAIDLPEGGVFDWFWVHKVPGSILLYVFSGVFALTGLFMHNTDLLGLAELTPFFKGLGGTSLVAFTSAMNGWVGCKAFGRVFSPLFQESTLAFAQEELIGKTVELMDVKCNQELMSEAKLVDGDARMLGVYLMVKPLEGEAEMKKGDLARVVSREGPMYRVARAQ